MHRTVVALAVVATMLTFNPGLAEPLWSFLSSLWSESSSDEGCGMDSLGRCLPAPQPESDAGCGFDPLGCPKGS